MNITQPEKICCKKCGKRLPVEVAHIKGEVTISVFCKNCKTVNVIKMKDETEG